MEHDEDGVLVENKPFLHKGRQQTLDGREIPDPVPMAPPIGFRASPPLHELIRARVQHEFERMRAAREVESPEEADDFRIPGEETDDPRESRFALMPGYEWEENYEPPQDFAEMRQRLIDAGWTPPADSGAKPARAPSGGAPAAVDPGKAPSAEPRSPASPGALGSGPSPKE